MWIKTYDASFEIKRDEVRSIFIENHGKVFRNDVEHYDLIAKLHNDTDLCIEIFYDYDEALKIFNDLTDNFIQGGVEVFRINKPKWEEKKND